VRNISLIHLAVLGAVALGLALAAGPSEAQTVAESRGAAIAQRDCSQCHAIGEMGDSPNAKAPRFRDLRKRFVVQDLNSRLLARMMASHADMPRFRLSTEERADLIAYLKSIQTYRKASGPAGGPPLNSTPG
jgi:cytochrome c